MQVLGSYPVRGVDSARWPNSYPPCGVAQGDLLIPVISSDISSECGVDGGGGGRFGTKGWKWVRHIYEWLMKHVVSG